jgi:glycosyltransferase involved in cell wall biosynthesis
MSAGPLSVLMISARADHGGGPEHMYRLLQRLDRSVESFAALPEDVPYHALVSGLLGQGRVLTIPHRAFRPGALVKIVRFIRNHGIRIVHSHGRGAGLYSRPAALLTGAFCVHTFHGVHVRAASGARRPAVVLPERFLSRFTDVFITVGEGEREEILGAGLVPPEKLTLIHNGVTIPPAPVTRPAGGRPVLLTVTRFDEAKDPLLLVPILRAVRDSAGPAPPLLKIVGDGPLRAETERAVASAGLSGMAEFTGALDGVEGVYKQSFCYLSTSKMEGLPLSVMEAMSHGIPCVVTDVPGNRDLVRDGVNGDTYRPDRPGDAAARILRLMGDAALWERYSANARREAAERYDVARMAERITSVYRQAENADR